MIAILAVSSHEVTTFVQRKMLSPEAYVWCNTVDKIRALRRVDNVSFFRIGQWYELSPQVIREFDKIDLEYNRERNNMERGGKHGYHRMAETCNGRRARVSASHAALEDGHRTKAPASEVSRGLGQWPMVLFKYAATLTAQTKGRSTL